MSSKKKITRSSKTKKNILQTNNKYILVDGTSSAGKSTICEYFNTKNYLCIKGDDYFDNGKINFTELFSKIKNKYCEGDKIYTDIFAKTIIDDAIKTNKNIIIDWVSQKEFIKYATIKNIKLNIILLFTNLDDLARNIEARRKSGDRRGVWVFNQFSERYIKCEDDDNKKIEIINRKKFTNLLLKYFKYEFKTKEDLIKFSNKIFDDMDIKDDKNHYIKLRDEYKYDYLLNTTGKTKNKIFEELDNVFNNML